jgi:hypothetical protein
LSTASIETIVRIPRARHLDQVPHQHRAQAAVLPVAGHGDRAFALVAACIDAVAGHAHEAFVRVLVHHRGERHLVPGVGMGDMIHECLAGTGHLAREAVAPRLQRQAVDERGFGCAVERLDRPDQHLAAVAQRVRPARNLGAVGRTGKQRIGRHGVLHGQRGPAPAWQRRYPSPPPRH